MSQSFTRSTDALEQLASVAVSYEALRMSTPRGEGSTPQVADSEETKPSKAALRPFMFPGVGRVMVFSNTAIFDSSPDDLQSNRADAIKSERASSSSPVTDTRRGSAPPPSPPQTPARHPSPPSPSSPPAKRTRRQTNLAANPASTPAAAPTPSSSSTPLLGLYDYPGPCARVAPPLPVPNLTKQSRGRKVPTVDSPPAPSPSTPPTSPPDSARAYICNVEGCAKCFSRREHLKRHVLSIHTHEKPFKCPFPSCEKFFSRRDNLIQHGKVHGESPTLKNNSSKRKAPSSCRKAR